MLGKMKRRKVAQMVLKWERLAKQQLMYLVMINPMQRRQPINSLSQPTSLYPLSPNHWLPISNRSRSSRESFQLRSSAQLSQSQP